MKWIWHPQSVRSYLLAWIIAPIAAFIVIDTFNLYHSALDSVNAAYDRMLVTTAYSVGDEVRHGDNGLEVSVSFASLEVYEAGFSTRMIYRINDMAGKFIAGDVDLPAYSKPIPGPPSAPTLLGIQEARYGNAEVRVASIYQPAPAGGSRVGAIIQIAEPIEFRKSVARNILLGTVGRQALLLAIVALVTMYVVARALHPLEDLRGQLDARRDDELSELVLPRAPLELKPVVDALNMLMERLRRQLDLQQRFVADASHQLRTPLAVLKTQLQSGLRGDAPPGVVLAEMASTVDRATNLANKLLSLAKVEQLRGKGGQIPCDLSAIVREVAVDLSPLISDKDLDFEFKSYQALVSGHPWMVGEMISNLLHNAIQHTPQGKRLGVAIEAVGADLFLRVWDTGPGIIKDLEESAFEPFAASYASKGGGLGLTICAEIADSMGASLTLKNRVRNGAVEGLDALVTFKNGGEPSNG